MCSALRSASLLLPCSVIFVESLTLNLQQPRVFEDGIKPSKKLVAYVKGRPRTSDENVEQIRESFVRSPQKSVRQASRELAIPPTTVWRVEVRKFPNDQLPQKWIGRCSANDATFCPWPPRSPDLTISDFFLWGYIKSIVYVPPLPKDLDELKSRITDAINLVTVDMLQQVYEEFEYRLDVCRASKGGHIEHL